MTDDVHARTRQYTGGAVSGAPVSVIASDSVNTRGGQAAVLGLANALVRDHPVLYVAAPDGVLQVGPGATLHEALTRIGAATDVSRLEVVESAPADVLRVGVGEDVAADLYVGADRFTGWISSDPSSVSAAPTTAYGAGIAAMLAAGHVFRRAVGLSLPRSGSVSLWDLAEATGATGPGEVDALDLGGTWFVGAGGVGSGAAWWCQLLGARGGGVVMDHDDVDITNLNRSLGMFYPDTGLATDDPAGKARLAAELIDATAFDGTWSQWMATNPAPPDVLVPAANEHGVRAAVATYSHPLALTGTTSPNWTAELHLYRAGIDSCLACRHPEPVGEAPLPCSTATVTTERGSHDAALSFLSGAAGLLTVAGLTLAQAGELRAPDSIWILDFADAHLGLLRSRRMTCAAECRRTQPLALRRKLYGDTRHGSRLT